MNFRIFLCPIWFLLTIPFFIAGNPAQRMYKLRKDIRDLMLNTTLEKLQRSDVIPNLPSPFRLNDTTLSVDSESAKGTFVLANAVAIGLNSLVDDVNVDLVGRKVGASIIIPSKVSVTGDYSLDGKVNPDEEESTAVSGDGAFTLTVSNLNIILEAKLVVGLLSGKVSISNLDLQVSYDSISINAENFSLNDETADWETVNNELNENFESIWSQYQEPLVIAITEGVNELMSETSLSDFIDVFQGKKTFGQVFLKPETNN